MNRDCYIVEDLLPLYHEGLIQAETTAWLEEHLKSCESCRELSNLSKDPVQKETIRSSVDNDQMFAKINLKLSVYQIIFVALSFFFAMKTSLLNESFGFILTYTILGFVTYFFYQRLIIVVTIAFLPTFIWSLAQSMNETVSILEAISGALFLALIHLLFAIIGSLVAFLLIKFKKEGN
ncbi:zf-HC2 domain-containing protein [Siminovitchia terrae]|uniref:Zf-HC2 domain-containing protein n=1 Tax=Siminovitchia terrae TaxID=1914933 RepID=A0A429X2F5_SIMTE|nr:zf-HC2 domain-containing protein [Siminovitchia terrae]RST57573.1 zf-HC2 domain-containing protein [Siminovitchia terrae]GIN90746.1 hypothetical protein J22TS1_17970 [Siminovitchia terrae]